ncbi:YqgE/AlgH family protein [Cognatishimia maritima]|uniref:UPF0301 protein SAMN04488044_2266 n=1 Tax=Cognatishimia maritima TaxID=870908 RepID=A0A1M5RR12_9RHOB|nr:YqgE/AlgH family protein [Cognatishimia maritima]SHH28551.1 putative transcriptional regulator [Cognatishimia maritima]
MPLATEELDLTGKILIAMPGMGDPRFAHSIVYMCAHSADGAMGLIVNKTMGKMTFSDLLEQLSIKETQGNRPMPLHFGGPVEGGRGFVLHSAEYRSQISTLPVDEFFSMTATLDVLEEMAQGKGPDKALMALGYSGWGPGQLEAEIADNGWLICDAGFELVFDIADDQKWGAALKTLGVDPLTLSASAGHA